MLPPGGLGGTFSVNAAFNSFWDATVRHFFLYPSYAGVFQFLLGCYSAPQTYAHTSAALSIPFGMLRGAEVRRGMRRAELSIPFGMLHVPLEAFNLALIELFQFLLGCYSRPGLAKVVGCWGLSIPFGMLHHYTLIVKYLTKYLSIPFGMLQSRRTPSRRNP